MKILNKKAHHKYQVLERVEAGIALTGAEIKSIRAGRANITESYARIKNGEIFLTNAYIKSWMGSQKFVDENRQRKLLLHKKQILSWQGKISQGSLVIVPLSMYIKNNLAKVELGLAKSKSKFDKRTALKKKAQERDIERELREKNVEMPGFGPGSKITN